MGIYRLAAPLAGGVRGGALHDEGTGLGGKVRGLRGWRALLHRLV